MNQKKLRKFNNEEFKEIQLEDKLKLRYAISNYGRLISFTENFEDGQFVKGSITEGYKLFRYKLFRNGKITYKHKFFYKLVVEYFIEKPLENQTCILHLDYNLANDYVGNLKWATKEERALHQKKNPKVILSQKKFAEENAKRNKAKGKLNSTQVMLIKKILAKPDRKTRMKIIAKRFGITPMQLYRIKSGENWGDIKV